MKKQYLKETLYTVLLLAAATGISFGFFYLGNKNIANITVTYTLRTSPGCSHRYILRFLLSWK